MKLQYKFSNGYTISILYDYGTYSTFMDGIPASDVNATFEVAVFYDDDLFYPISLFDDVLAHVKRPEAMLLAYRVSCIDLDILTPPNMRDPLNINPYDYPIKKSEVDIIKKLLENDV